MTASQSLNFLKLQLHLLDDAAGRQKLRRGDRHAEGQRITADQPAVALCPPAAQAAHQAKPAQQPDGAIEEADDQAGTDDDGDT